MKRGEKHTEESKRLIADANRKRARKPWNDEARKRLGVRMLGHRGGGRPKGCVGFWAGKKLSPETRRKMSEARKGKPKAPEHMAKIHEASFKKRKWTKIEQATAAVLDALGVEYIGQYKIGRYFIDFYVPSRNLVIECDGAYWHGRPGVPEKDARRDEVIRGLGYNILRLPESVIKAGTHTDVLKSVV